MFGTSFSPRSKDKQIRKRRRRNTIPYVDPDRKALESEYQVLINRAYLDIRILTGKDGKGKGAKERPRAQPRKTSKLIGKSELNSGPKGGLSKEEETHELLRSQDVSRHFKSHGRTTAGLDSLPMQQQRDANRATDGVITAFARIGGSDSGRDVASTFGNVHDNSRSNAISYSSDEEGNQFFSFPKGGMDLHSILALWYLIHSLRLGSSFFNKFYYTTSLMQQTTNLYPGTHPTHFLSGYCYAFINVFLSQREIPIAASMIYRELHHEVKHSFCIIRISEDDRFSIQVALELKEFFLTTGIIVQRDDFLQFHSPKLPKFVYNHTPNKQGKPSIVLGTQFTNLGRLPFSNIQNQVEFLLNVATIIQRNHIQRKNENHDTIRIPPIPELCNIILSDINIIAGIIHTYPHGDPIETANHRNIYVVFEAHWRKYFDDLGSKELPIKLITNHNIKVRFTSPFTRTVWDGMEDKELNYLNLVIDIIAEKFSIGRTQFEELTIRNVHSNLIGTYNRQGGSQCECEFKIANGLVPM